MEMNQCQKLRTTCMVTKHLKTSVILGRSLSQFSEDCPLISSIIHDAQVKVSMNSSTITDETGKILLYVFICITN